MKHTKSLIIKKKLETNREMYNVHITQTLKPFGLITSSDCTL